MRLSQEKEMKIRSYLGDEMSIKEIARTVGVTGSTGGIAGAESRGLSREEYQNVWAREKGYESFSDYRKKHRRSEEDPVKKTFREFLKERLERKRKSGAWLAGEIGSPREAVSQYIKGKTFPKQERLTRMVGAWGIQKNELEGLLERMEEAEKHQL